jgi:hypothetical protein
MQPQGMLPVQQTQMEEPSIRLDCRGLVSPLPCLPHPDPDPETVETLQRNLEDYQSLIVALPNHTNLTSLDHHHRSPIHNIHQQTQNIKKKRKKKSKLI